MSDPAGSQFPQNGYGEFNTLVFLVRQLLMFTRQMMVVQVKTVSNPFGALSPVGFVSVVPMVHMVDGANKATPHGEIPNVPYARIQGGTSAIILDPKPGDIGFMTVADRDISTVKATKAPGLPGSSRTFDFADGVYFGGILNGTPTQYIQFTDAGIKIHDLNGNTIEMKAGEIDITSAVVKINGELRATGAVTAGFGGGDQVGLQTHTHSGVQTGAGETAPPNAGT